MPAPVQRRFPFAVQALAASFVDLLGGAPDREPPKEFRIFRKGVNGSTKGDFLFDEEAASIVLSGFKAHGIDLMVDLDHSALAAPMVEAPAYGWIKGLDVRDGELWATSVTWEADGEALLRAGKYRYISPAFDWDEATGRIGKLITVSLTNTPALFNLDALVAASATQRKENDMEPELKKALDRNAELEKENAGLRAGTSTLVALTALAGLGASASGDDVRGAVQALTQFKGKVLELTGQASIPAALGVVEGWKSEAADAGRLKKEKEEVEQASFRKEIASALEQASKDGKITPAEIPGWEKDAVVMGGGRPSQDGVAWLSAKIKTLNPKPGQGGGNGGQGGEHRQPGGRAALSSSEQTVARLLRIPEKEWLDWDNKRSAGGGS